MEAFSIDETDEHDQEFSVISLTTANDVGGLGGVSHGANIAPAVLQRRLQAIGDLAERELNAIRSPPARVRGSPEANIELMRRRLQLPNHKRIPATLRRHIDSREDPLVAVASLLRFGGQEAQPKVPVDWQPRCRHIVDARLRKPCDLRPLFSLEDSRQYESEIFYESQMLQQFPSVESRARGKSFCDDTAESSSACDSIAAREEPGFGVRRLIPRTPTPQLHRTPTPHVRATPTPVLPPAGTPSPFLPAETTGTTEAPLVQQSVIPPQSARCSTSAPATVVQPDSPSMCSAKEEGRTDSRAYLGSSLEFSQMKDASDPAAFLMMYKQMLFEETNNGLMGGTPFLSDAGCSPEDLRSCIAQHLRQAGPWKGIARRNLSPLLSRSQMPSSMSLKAPHS